MAGISRARLASKWLGLTALLTTVALPASAFAQSVAGDLSADAQSNFARDRNISVRERPHPEYEAIGGRLGGFMLYPRIEGDVDYDTNIYAAPDHTVGDTIFRVEPEVNLVSTWSRHALQFAAGVTQDAYVNHSSENTTDWYVDAEGRLDFAGRTHLSGQLRHDRATELRSSDNNGIIGVGLPHPIQYDENLANLQLTREFNRLKLTGRTEYSDFRYSNEGAVELDLRDRHVATGMVRADYALSPATALFVEYTANDRHYRLHPIGVNQPDSSGYEVLGGANFELGHLVRGEVGAGYLSQSYRAASYAAVSGFGFRGKVEWFPTQLTTVTASASRSVEDSGIIIPFGADRTAGGYLYTQTQVRVDHELLRNLILTGGAGYERIEFRAITRTDDRWHANLGATYLLNRRVGLNASYTYLHQTSSGDLTYVGQRFSDNRLRAGVVLQF